MFQICLSRQALTTSAKLDNRRPEVRRVARLGNGLLEAVTNFQPVELCDVAVEPVPQRPPTRPIRTRLPDRQPHDAVRPKRETNLGARTIREINIQTLPAVFDLAAELERPVITNRLAPAFDRTSVLVQK